MAKQFPIAIVVADYTGLTGQHVLENGLESWLTCVQQFLKDKLPGKITKRNRTFASLQFKFDGYINVDLLLSPFWREPNQYYTFLQRIDFKERMKYNSDRLVMTNIIMI